MRPQNKNLRPNPQNLGNLVPLQEGEVSRPVRVRAPVEVFEWLRTMSAAELGALLTEVMLERAERQNAARPLQKQPRKPKPILEARARVLTALRGEGRLVRRGGAVFLVGPEFGEGMRVSTDTLKALGGRGWLMPDWTLTELGRAVADELLAGRDQ